MCGIFSVLSKDPIVVSDLRTISHEFLKSIHRGPDASQLRKLSDTCVIGFHRLSIMDPSRKGDQPMYSEDDNVCLLCNGEIYNFKELAARYHCQLTSNSDCEIILRLYETIGIVRTISELQGVFSFILYDKTMNRLFIGRDPIGVRSLYIGKSSRYPLCIASELKSIHQLVDSVETVPPGTLISVDLTTLEQSPHRYYEYNYPPMELPTLPESTDELSAHPLFPSLCNQLQTQLVKAVEARCIADRPIGCLLSGGLDSSLVAAIVSRYFLSKNQPLHTFSIGLQGSTDLYYAKQVAEHINSIHHEVIVTEDQMIQAIPSVISQIESYDTTSVRASTPMVLLCQYIEKHTDIRVIFSGEGADEASGSYLYFKNAPSSEDFQQETVRLLRDLEYFDVLRSDKSVSGSGLEVRVPFLDKHFLAYYMSLPPTLKTCTQKVEKFLLRSAFQHDNWLPDSVLWRQKEAFSDGCSSQSRSWYEIIQEHVNQIIPDEEFEANRHRWTHNPPQLKESYWYRTLFDSYYPKRESLIPYYWLPKWSEDTQDPSARVLSVYQST